MNAINDGGPAYPRPPFTPGALHDNAADAGFASTGHPGMSLRAWYAGKALVGVLASLGPLNPDPKLSQSDLDNMVAESCVRIADAMLRALDNDKQ